MTSRSDAGEKPLLSVVEAMRYVLVLPAAVLAAVAVAAYGYAGYLLVTLLRHVFKGSTTVGQNVVEVLQIVDVCLIGTATLVIATDLLVTFLITDGRFGTGHSASWLGANTVDALKARALSMVVLIMVVTFLETIVLPSHGRDALELGIAVAVVIVAIAGYGYVGSRGTRAPPD